MHYYSICEPDFSSVFSSFATTIKDTLEATIVFSAMQDGEVIDYVTVTRAGADVPITSSDYSISGKTVLFEPGILIDQDVITAVIQ